MSNKVTLSLASPRWAELLIKAMEGCELDNFSWFSQKPTLEREQQYLQQIIDDGDYLFIIYNDELRVVGTIGLREVDVSDFNNKTARVGMIIFRPEDRGKGYGRCAMNQLIEFAFNGLKMSQLYANVIASNKNQIDWDQSFGFVLEKFLEQAYQLKGKHFDMVKLVLTKDVWLKLKKEKAEKEALVFV